MKLQVESLKWALKNIRLFDDTDLFPLPEEFKIIWANEDKFINLLKDVDINNHNWANSRRFMVPKSDVAYRLVTQLYPTDSVLLTALIYEIGSAIEVKRIPVDEKVVFTYRFAPSEDGYMYSRNNAWLDFWNEGIRLSNSYSHVVQLDIADFYNQIYHHTIENELGGCGLSNQVIKSIVNLMNATTQRVSRGIPIGPYPVHLLAELSLVPIDDSLKLRGYQFIRFADDYIFFTNSEQQARAIIYEFANIIDKEQRLSIQNQKTKILTGEQFRILANDKISDQPISEEEKNLMAMLKRKSGGNPYASIRLYELDSQEMVLLTEDKLSKLLDSYLEASEIDFSKIRWIYRRLSQVGASSLIAYSIENFEKLLPAINDVCRYLLSTKDTYDGDWKEIGDRALGLLNYPIVKNNEYFQIAIINLFASNSQLNHFDKLLRLYRNGSEPIKRKIILMAYKIDASPWIREQKENVNQLNYWSKSAYYLSISTLKSEERKFLIRGLKLGLGQEDLLSKFILDAVK